MHEALLMADLVRKVEGIAQSQGLERVVSVRVQVDALTSLSGSHLKDNFALASQGTVVEGAQLEIEGGTEGICTAQQGLILVSMEVQD